MHSMAMDIDEIIYNDVMLDPDYECKHLPFCTFILSQNCLIVAMDIDNSDPPSVDREESTEIRPDLFLATLTEQELWEYLQLAIFDEPMEIESLINCGRDPSSDEEEDEPQTSNNDDQNDLFISSPSWSDNDSDLDRYVLSDCGAISYGTSDPTDDESDDQ